MNWHRALPQGAQAALKDAYEEWRFRVRRRAAERNVVEGAKAVSASCLQGIETLGQWEGVRAERREKLASMMGLSPEPERTPLNAVVKGVLKGPGYAVEKVVFESLPGLYVTANFYVPEGGTKRMPCILYLCGHWPSRDGAKAGFRDRYLWYPRHGFACLAVDPLEFGEVPGVHLGTGRLGWWHWLSLGYTPAGVEVWNAMRALDWLEQRTEVDAGRIGVTGISGGGIVTQYLAALDGRVSVAAPSCSTYTVGSQVAMNRVQEQCDCTFFHNVYGLDLPEVLALIAPRPVLVLGGRRDAWFPPEGFREAIERARRVFDLYTGSPGGVGRLRFVETSGGHEDTRESLDECHLWMERWLVPDPIPGSGEAAEGEHSSEDPSELRCLEVFPPSPKNFSIDETWCRRPERSAPGSRDEWEARRAALHSALEREVFAWIPREKVPFRTRRLRNSGGYAGEFCEFGDYEFDSEKGVPVRASVLKPFSGGGGNPLLLWVKSPAENVGFPDIDEMLPILRDTFVVILVPRFADRTLTAGDRARIERSAALSGKTIAAMAVWDVVRAAEWARTELAIKTRGMECYGRGEAGVCGLYAAMLEERFQHVILDRPPASHRDGPALLRILRHSDIPEVAGALAPRRLTLVRTSQDEAFEATRVAFHLADSAGSFARADSLADAVLNARVARSGTERAISPGSHLC